MGWRALAEEINVGRTPTLNSSAVESLAYRLAKTLSAQPDHELYHSIEWYLTHLCYGALSPDQISEGDRFPSEAEIAGWAPYFRERYSVDFSEPHFSVVTYRAAVDIKAVHIKAIYHHAYLALMNLAAGRGFQCREEVGNIIQHWIALGVV